jgi:hypothetical protein
MFLFDRTPHKYAHFISWVARVFSPDIKLAPVKDDLFYVWMNIDFVSINPLF